MVVSLPTAPFPSNSFSNFWLQLVCWWGGVTCHRRRPEIAVGDH